MTKANRAAINQQDFDTETLVKIFDEYADKIYRLAMGILGHPEDAEDIVQVTFVKAMEHIKKFQRRSNYSTWLYRIAYNASIDLLRKQKKHIQAEGVEQENKSLLPQVLVEWNTPEKMLLNKEFIDYLDEALKSIPESLRIVFILRDIEGLSTREVAEILGISTSLVKVRLHRTRLSLREMLAKYFNTRQKQTG